MAHYLGSPFLCRYPAKHHISHIALGTKLLYPNSDTLEKASLARKHAAAKLVKVLLATHSFKLLWTQKHTPGNTVESLSMVQFVSSSHSLKIRYIRYGSNWKAFVHHTVMDEHVHDAEQRDPKPCAHT